MDNYNYIKRSEMKSRSVGIALSILLGMIGMADFYVGKNKRGFIRLGIAIFFASLKLMFVPVVLGLIFIPITITDIKKYNQDLENISARFLREKIVEDPRMKNYGSLGAFVSLDFRDETLETIDHAAEMVKMSLRKPFPNSLNLINPRRVKKTSKMTDIVFKAFKYLMFICFVLPLCLLPFLIIILLPATLLSYSTVSIGNPIIYTLSIIIDADPEAFFVIVFNGSLFLLVRMIITYKGTYTYNLEQCNQSLKVAKENAEAKEYMKLN